MDSLSLNEVEIGRLEDFQNQIIQNQGDYELYDDIFFNKIANMNIYDKIKDVEVVGGSGKKFAIDKIIKRDNIDINGILYIGDSITDVEPLEFAKLNEGISISFNGNEYPLKVAQIAIVSKSAIATAVIANIYAENDKSVVLNFVKEYNENKNLKELFNDYNIDIKIKNRFFEVFDNEDYPIIRTIDDKNFDEILKASKSMRNNIRGQDIGGLG